MDEIRLLKKILLLCIKRRAKAPYLQFVKEKVPKGCPTPKNLLFTKPTDNVVKKDKGLL